MDEYEIETTTRNDSGSPSWDSDEALDALNLERQTHGTESNAALTRRLISEAAPLAAQSIIQLAVHGGHESIRLRASQYLIDKAEEFGGTAKETWEGIVDEVTQNLEDFANGK